jgi:hypothetical protein
MQPCATSQTPVKTSHRRTKLQLIPVDEASRRDSRELKLLHEAVELFTVLFKVNCSKFGEIMGRQLPDEASNCQLAWAFWPAGAVPFHNRAALTWGDLLGFANDTWTNSPEFLSAMHKLEMMEGKQAVGMFGAPFGLALSWTCVFPASEIRGVQESAKAKYSLGLFSHQLGEVMSSSYRSPLYRAEWEVWC